MLVNPFGILKNVLPIVQFTNEYNTDKALADLVAGITVGLTLIPQSLAYASLAGLDPQYGLYSSLSGGIIYALFGTIAEINIAPTALLSLLTHTYTYHISFGNVAAAVLLCFLSGAVELLCGVLHLGFLVDFVSTPVVAAFTSAGAITIGTAQVKNLFGLHYTAENFVESWQKFFENISVVKKWDTTLGICCCIFLLSMRKLKDFGVPPIEDKISDSKKNTSSLKKLIWFLSVSRNALVVVVSALMAYVFELNEMKPFGLTARVPAGWPNISFPAFSIQTENRTVDFVEMIREMGSGVVVMPFVAILGNVAIAKAFSQGKVVDATQEMVAVGICNLVGSFFKSYPVNASFSRSAVSNASGVKTPLAGIYAGIMVILALTFLTPYFSYIPKATLAAVIICAVLFMIEVAITKMIWLIHKVELVTFIITLLSSLFLGIEVGILIGVLVDILMLLYSTARPKVAVEKVEVKNGLSFTKVTPSSSIMFPSAEYVRERILKNNVESGTSDGIVVIDCNKISRLDFTAVKCIGALVSDLKKTGKSVIFFSPEPTVEQAIHHICECKVPITRNEEELQLVLKGKHDRISTITFENNVIRRDEEYTTPL